MYSETIGLVGGFGGFATLDFFRRLLEAFATGKERDYPRIVMDDDFTMPSRTRALLYDENIEEITHMIARSINNLIEIGADKIILVCGTAHWFLDGVYQLVPEAKYRVVDIIDTMGKKLKAEGASNCFVIAAEGTMKKRLYNSKLARFGVDVYSPCETDWQKVRYFIEATKQNKITPALKQEFTEFILDNLGGVNPIVNGKPHVVLGCTELPPLVNEEAKKKIIFEDPLEIVLSYLKDSLI